MKAKKIVRVIVLVLLLTLIAPISVVPTNVIVAKAATIKISKRKLSLEKGKTSTLKISGTKASIKWTSNKKTVATVSKVGKVKAIKAGTATITASVKGKKYNCKVTVTDKPANNVEILNLTVKMPKNWIYEDLISMDGIVVGAIKPKNAKSAGVVVVGMDVGMKVDTNEMQKELLKQFKDSTMIEDAFATAFISEDIKDVKVKNVKVKKYDSKVGKTIKIDCEMSLKVNGKSKKVKLPLYIVLYKTYMIEFIGVDYDKELKTSIDQATQDILNTIKIKK